MGVYRDSVLGLCLDIRGPDGNVFNVMGIGNDLARQLHNEEDWKQALNALRGMEAGYMSYLHMFREYFPMVTLVGFEEVARRMEQIHDSIPRSAGVRPTRQ